MKRYCEYIEINNDLFPSKPGYHPRDAVEVLYGPRDDSRGDMEKVMYQSYYDILRTNCFMKQINKMR